MDATAKGAVQGVKQSKSRLAVVARVSMFEGKGVQQLLNDGVDSLAKLEGEGAAEEGRIDGEIVLFALQLHVCHFLNLPLTRSRAKDTNHTIVESALPRYGQSYSAHSSILSG
jgi:hypothetical protein